MRISSATLLLSSVSVLSTTTLAAPLRIVVVEKVSSGKLDDFFRSVRVGHAAAGAFEGASFDGSSSSSSNPSDEFHALPFPIDFNIKPEPRPAFVADEPVVGDDSSSPSPKGVPMTPELEFDPPFGFLPNAECRDEGSMRVKWEKFEDKIRTWLGLSVVARSPLCTEAPVASLFSSERPEPKKMVPAPMDVPARMPCHNTAAAATVPGLRPGSVTGIHIVATSPPVRSGMWRHRYRSKLFKERLQRALNALSPFEAGVLAFVVGCGLGVLVRMVVVFIILGVRMWKCSKKRRGVQLEEDGEEEEDGKQGDEIVGVVLFDAGSIKGASVEDLPLYQEKV